MRPKAEKASGVVSDQALAGREAVQPARAGAAKPARAPAVARTRRDSEMVAEARRILERINSDITELEAQADRLLFARGR